ncbi:LPS translocon maturation chaperone LptM [Geminicoccus roseus]|nr:lipoprotein [Geminicoccus roseus]
MRPLALAALLALALATAACGKKGDPEVPPPEPAAAENDG